MTTATARKPMTKRELRAFLNSLTILQGSHTPDGQMCVMEAVAFVAGEPWSDSPKCASSVISGFLRSWNDAMNDEDRQMLKPLIPRLVDTAASKEVERERSWMALDWFCRVSAPAWLRCAGLTAAAERIEATAPIVDSKSAKAAQDSLVSARAEASAARDAAWDAAGDAARDAAWAAARAAARDAARDAAWDAARDAAWDAAGDAAWDALRSTVVALQASAIQLVERMIDVQQEKAA